MDEVLSAGTAPTREELSRELGIPERELSAALLDLEAAACIARQDEAHASLDAVPGRAAGAGAPRGRRDLLRAPVRGLQEPLSRLGRRGAEVVRRVCRRGMRRLCACFPAPR